ncbi:hypothetical protein [Burkholderia sp. BCC0405]|uniref:hypothetical protein n=1 Tax=Burkholderia sp. BCC0405 TaxID=2676298 RepID=UPI0024462053|nr:hypothetical protein [Burkholderia sp. BCC0405]
MRSGRCCRHGPIGRRAARERSGHRHASRAPASHARRDGRVTGIGSQILRELGVRRLNVLSSPFRLPALSEHDLEIMAFIPLGDDAPESAPGAHPHPLRAA